MYICINRLFILYQGLQGEDKNPVITFEILSPFQNVITKCKIWKKICKNLYNFEKVSRLNERHYNSPNLTKFQNKIFAAIDANDVTF